MGEPRDLPEAGGEVTSAGPEVAARSGGTRQHSSTPRGPVLMSARWQKRLPLTHAMLRMAADREVSARTHQRVTHNASWRLFHGPMLRRGIEKAEREPMFKDTRAFSGFSVDDLQR